MQLIQTLLLASAVAVVQGFVVPVGTPDGHYIVATDENGKATSGLIPSAVRRGAPASVRHRLAETEGLKRARHGGAALDKRGSFPEPPEKVDVSCLGPLLEPDTEHAAWQQAVDFWKGQRLISNSTSHIWISSSATQSSVWYICNFNKDWFLEPSVDNMYDAGSRMYQKCGPVQAAKCSIKDWGMRFGRDIVGSDICTNPT